MIKNCLNVICLLLIFILFQSFLNTTKRKSRKSFQEYIAQNHYKAIINETDSTIEFSLIDSSVKPFKEMLYFKHGLCYKDINTFTCDSCMEKALAPILANQTWKWVKISDKKYIGKRKFILDIISDGINFSYILKREKIKRKYYYELTKEK